MLIKSQKSFPELSAGPQAGADFTQAPGGVEVRGPQPPFSLSCEGFLVCPNIHPAVLSALHL